jgi:hypothetical protein
MTSTQTGQNAPVAPAASQRGLRPVGGLRALLEFVGADPARDGVVVELGGQPLAILIGGANGVGWRRRLRAFLAHCMEL